MGRLSPSGRGGAAAKGAPGARGGGAASGGGRAGAAGAKSADRLPPAGDAASGGGRAARSAGAAAARPRSGHVPAARAPRLSAGGSRGSARRAAARLPKQLREAWDRPLTAYYVIMGAALLITVLGLVMVYSASMIQALRYGLPSTYYFRKQLMAVAIGSVLLYAAARMPIRLHRALAYPLLLGAVFLMCLVQVPGIGQTVNGNTNWLSIGGPFQLQPSEFGKLALVLWGADLLARKNEKKLLTQWKHLLVPLVPVAVLLLGLIMLGGDMGTTMVLTAVLFGLLWLAGAPTRMFTGVLAAAGALAALFVLTSPNRMGRLHCIAATSPGAGDQCWQAVHGIYALASGGWFGTGLGASVEKWGELPEPHTDFIFAVTGEELGLAGTLSVLALFAALGYAGIRVAGRTEDPFVRFAAGGVTTWITVQSVINVGAVLGLLPIAGVPLPLFSYGGSALLPTMYAVGLLIAFARSEPAARAALVTRERSSLTRAMRRTMRRRTGRRPSGER
ncbi:putative lipid II flippase FtsW [Actinacidiphila sp. bgisy144]|uniref:putative lipid II flippase FtsW n=1 Tax=unclassified Actinacidiphila TaxID=2995708 RepID=UPI003EBE1A6F